MINTSLCYIEHNGKYLMLHRVKKQNDINFEKWLGIGGKFEERESPEECLLREVKEETGLTLTSFKYRGIITFVSDVCDTEYLHLFTADGFTGELISCNEGELEWVKKDELSKLPMWEGDKIFISLLENNEPFFSLKFEYLGDKLISAILNGKKVI